MNAGTQRTIQRAMLRRLTQTCVIRRITSVTDDGYGQPQETTSDTSSACFLSRDRRAPAEAGVTGADIGKTYYMLTLPYDADIEESDSVIVDGLAYEVSQVETEHGNGVLKQARIVKAGS